MKHEKKVTKTNKKTKKLHRINVLAELLLNISYKTNYYYYYFEYYRYIAYD